MKRKRSTFDEEEEEEDEEFELTEEKEETVTNPPKRRKIELFEEEEEDEGEEEEEGEDEFLSTSDEDEENSDGKPFAGIIKSIHMENFLCHNNFKIKFDPKLTVITGRNGSGKTAILSALQICLGERRSRSASNLTEFIGHSGEVTLLNVGVDAYRKDLFGDEIIIERRIVRGGGNTYKIKNDDGKTIYTRKKELETILNHFNIHVGNPAVVMQQDESKKFFQDSGGNEKYQFFLEASQLKEMIDNFDIEKEQEKEMDRNLKIKREKLDRDKRRLDKLEEDMLITRKIGEIKGEHKLIEAKISWKVIKFEKFNNKKSTLEVENKFNLKKEKRIEEENKLGLIKEELKKIREDVREKENKDTEISEKLSDTSENGRNLMNKIKNLQGEITKTRKYETSIKQKISNSSTHIKNGEKKIKKAEKKIEQIKNRKKKDTSEEQKDVEKKIKEIQEKHKIAKEEIKKKKNEYETAEDECDDLKTKWDRKRTEARVITQRIEKKEKKIRKMKQQEKSRINYFDGDRLKLANLCFTKYKKSFSQIPIGPVGVYLKLSDEKWKNACEQHLRYSIQNTFLVNSKKDIKTMQNICAKEHLRSPNIVLYEFTQRFYNPTPQQLPDRNEIIMNDIIQINTDLAVEQKFKFPQEFLEPTIRSYLMDFHHIENMVLKNTRNEVNFQRFPRNVTKVFCLNGTEMFIKGGTSETTLGRNVVAEFFGRVDFKSLIQNIQGEIKEIRENEEKHLLSVITSIKKQFNEKKKLRQKKNSEWKEKKRLTIKYKRKLDSLRNELEDILQQNDDDNEEKEQEIEKLEEIIQKNNEDISKYQEKIEKFNQDLQSIPENEKKKIKDHEEAKKKHKEVKKLQEKIELEAEKIGGEINEIKSKLEHVKGSFINCEKHVETLKEQEKEVKQNYLNRKIDAERKSPEPVISDKTLSELQQERDNIDRKLNRKKVELNNRTVEDIQKEYDSVNRTFKDSERDDRQDKREFRRDDRREFRRDDRRGRDDRREINDRFERKDRYERKDDRYERREKDDRYERRDDRRDRYERRDDRREDRYENGRVSGHKRKREIDDDEEYRKYKRERR